MIPKPPKHLKPATRKWWTQIVTDYDLSSSDLRLLTLSAEAHDRCTDARETVAKEGAFYKNFHGEPRAHPAVAVERDARLAVARLLRELALDAEPLPDPRVPRLRGRS